MNGSGVLVLWTPTGGRFLPLLGGRGDLQFKQIEKGFMESYTLQTSVGDLPSAAEGFDALVRSRRGAPWTAGTAVAAEGETPVEKWRDDNIETGGGGDDRGIRSVAPDALEVFVERYEGVVREFSARAASNFAYANSEVGSVASHAALI